MKTIESDRLRIREWDESDAPALQALELKASYSSYLQFNTVSDSLDAIRIWKEHQEMFPVMLKATGELIGIVGLVDVGMLKMLP